MKEFLQNLIDQIFNISRCPNCKNKRDKSDEGTLWYDVGTTSSWGLSVCNVCLDNPKKLNVETLRKHAEKYRWSKEEIVLLEKAVRDFQKNAALTDV